MQKQHLIQGLKWSAVFLWMGLIFWFSAQNAVESSALSGGIVDRLMDFLEALVQNNWGKDVWFQRSALVFIVRKGAHMSVYLVLSCLVMNAWNPTLSRGQKKMRTFVFGLVYAISDEGHQHFVPGRSAELRDVLIDITGVLLGILLITLLHSLKMKQNTRKNHLSHKSI